MRHVGRLAIGAAMVWLAGIGLAGCGPTPAEQAAMAAAQHAQDQNRCAGFGFAPGTDAFAHCMMGLSTQRDAEAAADHRAALARAAADQRAANAAQAAKDAADKDAWDRRTGQGQYASPSFGGSESSSGPFGPSPVDQVQKSIEDDMRKMEGGSD